MKQVSFFTLNIKRLLYDIARRGVVFKYAIQWEVEEKFIYIVPKRTITKAIDEVQGFRGAVKVNYEQR